MPPQSSRIEWLFRPLREEISPPTFEIRAPGAWTRFERFEPSADISVFLTTAEIDEAMEIDARRATEERRLYSFVGLDGEMRIDLTDGASVSVTPRNAPIYVPPEARGLLVVGRQRKMRSAGFSIRVDRVRQMLDGATSPAMTDFLSGGGSTRVVAVTPPRRLRELAVSLFSARHHGPLQLVFIEGVVLQILAVHAAAAGLITEEGREPLFPDDRRRVELARERLVADMARPPAIATLAAEAGLSVRALNAGFRALYGGSVYEVLRDERLEHARVAIEMGGLSIKEIATRVGYNHVSNFTNAFARRYGSPPLRFRRSRMPLAGRTAQDG